MTIMVPDIGTRKALDDILANILTIKLFSNAITPAVTDIAATYTEVTGGGYVSKTLTSINWSITTGNPSSGIYTLQTWTFTGAIGGSGIVYGYYVIDAAGILRWSEAFTNPVTPILNSQILIVPSLTADNV